MPPERSTTSPKINYGVCPPAYLHLYGKGFLHTQYGEPAMLATRQVPVRYVYTRRRTSSALLLSGTTPLTTPSAYLAANNYITAASAKYYRHFFSLTSQNYTDSNVGQIILHRLGDWWGRAKKSLLRRPVEKPPHRCWIPGHSVVSHRRFE